jgi:hypothetical protein
MTPKLAHKKDNIRIHIGLRWREWSGPRAQRDEPWPQGIRKGSAHRRLVDGGAKVQQLGHQFHIPLVGLHVRRAKTRKRAALLFEQNNVSGHGDEFKASHLPRPNPQSHTRRTHAESPRHRIKDRRTKPARIDGSGQERMQQG